MHTQADPASSWAHPSQLGRRPQTTQLRQGQTCGAGRKVWGLQTNQLTNGIPSSRSHKPSEVHKANTQPFSSRHTLCSSSWLKVPPLHRHRSTDKSQEDEPQQQHEALRISSPLWIPAHSTPFLPPVMALRDGKH